MFDVVKKACQMCDVQPATHLASASREYDPDRLATEHLWIIDARLAAFGFLRAHPLWPDAYQNAAVALVKASRRYQPKRGSFESYARVWVDNTIRETVCRGGVVRLPVKKALRRVRRGERAALPTVPYLEVSAAEDNASHHRMMLAASATRCPDEEDAMVVRVDKQRTMAWLEARLGELTAAQRAAVLAKLAGTSLVDFAARAGMHRDTALQRTKEGLEYLRAEARGDGLEL
jgi:RNA polymerase sigma factor (sigma-70 family)